jgi:uncharacterized protein YneF (UPF0154 family)
MWSGVRRSIVRWLCVLGLPVVSMVALSTHQLSAEPSINPQQIPELLTEKGKKLSAMKAVMNVTTSNDAEKSRQDIKGFLLYRRPSDFRFQGVAPGGNSLFELVVKDQVFELYVPTDGKIVKGGKECFGKRFPEVAEIEGLVPIMLLQWRNVRFQRMLKREADTVVINITFDGRNWEATLESGNLLLKRLVRFDAHNHPDLYAEFGEYKSGEDGWLPRRFDVRAPRGQWRTHVQITKIEANPFLVEKNFKLEPAFSTKIENCR